MNRIIGLAAILALVFVLIGCESGESPSATADNRPIVCFGDSLTEGYGASRPGTVDKSKSYPAFLQNKVTVPVENAGISGDTAAGALARMDRDVLSRDPQAVIILLGANDFFRLRPARETKQDLQAIINKLKTGDREIYLASFIGDSAWEDAILGIIPNFILIDHVALFADYKKMFAELSSENKELTFIPNIWTGVWGIHMSDPIHPNAAGYEIMANTIFNAIKPYLQANNLLE